MLKMAVQITRFLFVDLHISFLHLLIAWYSSNLQFICLKCEILDILQPYKNQHGSLHSHRFIRDCQPLKYGNVTHEISVAHQSNFNEPFIEVKYFIKDYAAKTSNDHNYGHLAIINNPLRTISVLEPGRPGGCNKQKPVRETVKNTAKPKNCLVAINAGFFNTKTGNCIGNIISSGKKIQDSGGIQNAHFGIKKDGTIFMGYLSDDYMKADFLQLVGGVIWLLRDGEIYINESLIAECSESEETGTLERFANVQSARSAVGHDAQGRIILAHVEGRTNVFGITLWEFAELLRLNGVVNAINLDGGGSATFVINGTVVNYPSDKCGNYVCERRVSTVLCAHEPICECSNNGKCILGKCHCNKNWLPPACDKRECDANNCSNYGKCTDQGCECLPGRTGQFCELECQAGWYGSNCSQVCNCPIHVACNTVNGDCLCSPGYIGKLCEFECAFGKFGVNCAKRCDCPNTCSCNHITGICHDSFNTSSYLAAACIVNQIIEKQKLVKSHPEQYRLWMITVITSSSIAAASIILNLSLLCHKYLRKSYSYSYHPLLEKSDNSEEMPLTEEAFLNKN